MAWYLQDIIDSSKNVAKTNIVDNSDYIYADTAQRLLLGTRLHWQVYIDVSGLFYFIKKNFNTDFESNEQIMVGENSRYTRMNPIYSIYKYMRLWICSQMIGDDELACHECAD